MDYLLDRPDVASAWHRYTHHPFVLAMADGSLPLESFKGYLVQCVASMSSSGVDFGDRRSNETRRELT